MSKWYNFFLAPLFAGPWHIGRFGNVEINVVGQIFYYCTWIIIGSPLKKAAQYLLSLLALRYFFHDIMCFLFKELNCPQVYTLP